MSPHRGRRSPEVGSISSTFTLAKQSSLTDFGNQINDNKAWLTKQAASVGMAPNGVIAQGFGVVTSVIYATCGLNLGAETEESTFSISGSVDATNAMSGNAGVGAKGSYASTDESAAFESHLWPAQAGSAAPQPIAIAFEFACFVGDTILPGWITNVSELTIVLDDSHGGTYIVDGSATYDLHGAAANPVTAQTSGGRVVTMDPIPPDATNLVLNLTFEAISSDHKQFTWPAPLGVFPNGQIVIDLYGVWPGNTTATCRSTGESH